MNIDQILADHGIGQAIGTATPGDVRATKTFSSTALVGATGTLADNGNGPTVNPSVTIQTLGAGIYDTPITVNPVTGTATAADVLAGYTFSSASGVNQTGAMPENGSPTLYAGQSIASGHYTGGAVSPVKMAYGAVTSSATDITTWTIVTSNGGSDSIPSVTIPVPSGAQQIIAVTVQDGPVFTIANPTGYADGSLANVLAFTANNGGYDWGCGAGSPLQIDTSGIVLPFAQSQASCHYTVYYV